MLTLNFVADFVVNFVELRIQDYGRGLKVHTSGFTAGSSDNENDEENRCSLSLSLSMLSRLLVRLGRDLKLLLPLSRS